MITVLLADDQSMMRVGLAGIIASAADLEIVGEAADGNEAVAVALAVKPNCILMDLRMPCLDGVGAIRAIRRDDSLQDVRILVLTTFDDDTSVVEAIAAGADGFLSKGSEPDDLLRAIRTVVAGDAALSQPALRAIAANLEASRGASPQIDRATQSLLDRLTPREQKIVAAVGSGHSNAQIGAALFISPYTVKSHLSNAMTKIAATDRAQVAIFAFRSLLVKPYGSLVPEDD